MICARMALLVTTVLCFGGAAQAEDQRAEDQKSAKFEWLVIAAATSDYTYRGVSLNDEKPTPMLYAEARYGIFYVNGFLIGTELGDDALGRSIGNIEADATAGVTPSIGILDFNIGIKYTGYPNGRDLIFGTLEKAERDFIEPFIGVTANLASNFSLTGTAFWTPDYYYQTGEVFTLEGQATFVLPEWQGFTSKLSGVVGHARSDQADVIAPGYEYVYWNAGIEARLERLIFDFRYWDTDVSSIDEFGSRFVFSAGVALN